MYNLKTIYQDEYKNQHMTIFYNISIPTFLVDCPISAMPTKIARGGKNSLNYDKNPQPPKIPNRAKNLSERSELCPTAKNLRQLKIPLPNPKMVNQNGAKNLPKIRHFLVNQGTNLRSKNPYSFIITFLSAPDVIDF